MHGYIVHMIKYFLSIHQPIFVHPLISLIVKSIFLLKENFECLLQFFKAQLGPVAKNATLGHPAGNRTRTLANLVRCSTNWATEAFADSMAASSVFYMAVMPIKRRINSMWILWHLYSTTNSTHSSVHLPIYSYSHRSSHVSIHYFVNDFETGTRV